MLGLLGVNPDLPLAVGGHNFDTDLSGIFARLLALTDEEVMAILAVVMGETLAAGHPIVGSVGAHLGTRYWQADPAFLDLARDREALTAMLDEVAEPGVAEANAKEKVKVLKSVLGDYLTGRNGRSKGEGWVPRWLRFPANCYTGRGCGRLSE
jgi:ParB family chromosome partitioning protein